MFSCVRVELLTVFIKPQTKEVLAASLENILERKSFEKTTVEDIINECGVSRTTFYRHFTDKYELMNWVYKNHVDNFNKANPEISSWRNMVLDVCHFIDGKQNYFGHIVRFTGQNSFNDFLFGYSVRYCEDRLQKAAGYQRVPEEMIISAEMYVAGTEHALLDWIKSDYRLPPEKFSNLLCANMPIPLRNLFG